MNFKVIVLQAVLLLKGLDAVFVKLLRVRVPFEAQTKRCLTSVRFSRDQINPSSFLCESILQVRNRFLVNILVISHGHDRLRDDDSIFIEHSEAVFVEFGGEEYFTATVWYRVS